MWRIKKETSALGHVVLTQSLGGLGSGEVDLATLLAHDPPEQLGEHRVRDTLAQLGMARLGAPLVHRPQAKGAPA